MTIGPTLIYNPNKSNNLLWCLYTDNPNKSKIFCDLYKTRNPTKGTIFYDLYKSIAKNAQKHSNLRNCLESNQCTGGYMLNHKNRDPCQNLPQSCKGSKFVRPVWIRHTDHFQSHLRTSFSIIERWSKKYYTHKSIIKTRILEQIILRKF